ncbi:unnamed protein product [Wuchereria bancrofti]|uniref:Uncharacterized protein n=2 Tax=Wuchereria bancrofti TaxID=6293 RepID=A0A3P7EJ27_WUCBA|nr:unnamed protein product [Wuchereria bancrofti]
MSVEETRKKSSPSYLIRKNLQYLENTAKKAVEQGIELCGKKPPVELNYEETTEWLKQQKSDVGKQIIVLDGIISKANNLEKLKGLLRSLGEWENDLHYTKNIGMKKNLGMGENIETTQLEVMVTDRIPESMAKGLRRMKLRDLGWTMENTINVAKLEIISRTSK